MLGHFNAHISAADGNVEIDMLQVLSLEEILAEGVPAQVSKDQQLKCGHQCHHHHNDHKPGHQCDHHRHDHHHQCYIFFLQERQERAAPNKGNLYSRWLNHTCMIINIIILKDSMLLITMMIVMTVVVLMILQMMITFS